MVSDLEPGCFTTGGMTVHLMEWMGIVAGT